MRLRYEEQALEVEIANEQGNGGGAMGVGSGQGPFGMRERVRVYGGTLETGSAPDGGFLVRARLPLEAARE